MDKHEINAKISNAKVYRIGMHYYLRLEYLLEVEEGIFKITIPKIDIGIRDNDFSIVPEQYPSLGEDGSCCLKNYYGCAFPILPYDLSLTKFYYTELIESKPKIRNMTVEEIEKELGYRIKIISKGGEQE